MSKEMPGDPPAKTSAADAACKMCGSRQRVVDEVRGEVACAECGLVVDPETLVATPPRPVSVGGSDGSGRGIGPFVAGTEARRSLGSVLWTRRDGQGRPLGWKRRYEFQHLKRVMLRQTARTNAPGGDRSMAGPVLARVSEQLGLPQVVAEEANRIFQEAKNHGLLRGRSLPASVGASIYAACRRYEIPRTLSEVARAAGARRAEVGRSFKVLRRDGATQIPAVGTRTFLMRYAEELALSSTVRSTVEEMLEWADSNPELSGLSPHGLVAALIYLAAERNGERRSRAQLARVSAVTEVTLRSTSRLVERLLGGRGVSGRPR